MTSRSIAQLEADIVALRASAERAGTALACLFSSSDEFEAEVVRVRREQGAYAGTAAHAAPLPGSRRLVAARRRLPADLDAFRRAAARVARARNP